MIIDNGEEQRKLTDNSAEREREILFAESYEERPIDRDYNRHGGDRITQMEILGGGIAYCVRIAYPGNVIIGYKI